MGRVNQTKTVFNLNGTPKKKKMGGKKAPITKVTSKKTGTGISKPARQRQQQQQQKATTTAKTKKVNETKRKKSVRTNTNKKDKDEVIDDIRVVPPLSCIPLQNVHDAKCHRKRENLNKKMAKEKGNNLDPVTINTTTTTAATVVTADTKTANAQAKIQAIRYDPSKYGKLVNVFNGQSGEGLCYKFGVIRKGGKPFMELLAKKSRSFLLEMVFKCVRLCETKNKSIVSSEMVCMVAQTYGITPVF